MRGRIGTLSRSAVPSPAFDAFRISGSLSHKARREAGPCAAFICIYTYYMEITFDPAKRETTLRERKLDFKDATDVFAGKCIHIPDERRDYGEARIITIGTLLNRMVIVVWTPRGEARHVFSMRKANDREKARFGQRLEES